MDRKEELRVDIADITRQIGALDETMSATKAEIAAAQDRIESAKSDIQRLTASRSELSKQLALELSAYPMGTYVLSGQSVYRITGVYLAEDQATVVYTGEAYGDDAKKIRTVSCVPVDEATTEVPATHPFSKALRAQVWDQRLVERRRAR